jgi:hypothetical protein
VMRAVADILIISCLWVSCEALLHVDNNAFVTESGDKASDNNRSIDSDVTALVNIDETYHPVNKKVKNISKNIGFDLPLDPFTLHHPYIHSSMTEFEYSEWYFLFFTFFDKSSSPTIDVSLTVPELAKSLSSKLSVPASVFSISRAEKYRSNSISANLSLTNHTIPRLYPPKAL